MYLVELHVTSYLVEESGQLLLTHLARLAFRAFPPPLLQNII